MCEEARAKHWMVSEQGELADGYTRLVRTIHSVPNAVEHCGISLSYGFEQPPNLCSPICRIWIFVLYVCIYIYIPLELLSLSLTQLPTKMKLICIEVLVQSILYPALQRIATENTFGYFLVLMSDCY